MLEEIKVLGTVVIGETDQKPLMVARNEWLKLSEDIGGMTLIGTFFRTDALRDKSKKEFDNA
jgi:hypothetical protein